VQAIRDEFIRPRDSLNSYLQPGLPDRGGGCDGACSVSVRQIQGREPGNVPSFLLADIRIIPA
jgi:hypothetical protein